jgi:hypothetical protein
MVLASTTTKALAKFKLSQKKPVMEAVEGVADPTGHPSLPEHQVRTLPRWPLISSHLTSYSSLSPLTLQNDLRTSVSTWQARVPIKTVMAISMAVNSFPTTKKECDVEHIDHLEILTEASTAPLSHAPPTSLSHASRHGQLPPTTTRALAKFKIFQKKPVMEAVEGVADPTGHPSLPEHQVRTLPRW